MVLSTGYTSCSDSVIFTFNLCTKSFTYRAMTEEKLKLVEEYESIEIEILKLQQKLKRVSEEISELEEPNIKVKGFKGNE